MAQGIDHNVNHHQEDGKEEGKSADRHPFTIMGGRRASLGSMMGFGGGVRESFIHREGVTVGGPDNHQRYLLPGYLLLDRLLLVCLAQPI